MYKYSCNSNLQPYSGVPCVGRCSSGHGTGQGISKLNLAMVNTVATTLQL